MLLQLWSRALAPKSINTNLHTITKTARLASRYKNIIKLKARQHTVLKGRSRESRRGPFCRNMFPSFAPHAQTHTLTHGRPLSPLPPHSERDGLMKLFDEAFE